MDGRGQTVATPGGATTNGRRRWWSSLGASRCVCVLIVAPFVWASRRRLG